MNNVRVMLCEILFITGDPMEKISVRSGIPLTTLYDLISRRVKQPHGKTILFLFYFYCKVITEARLRTSYRYYPVLDPWAGGARYFNQPE